MGLQAFPSNRRHFSGRIGICEYSRTSMWDHLLVSNHLPQATANSQHQNFPSQSLTVGTSSYKRPPPVSVRDHFLGLTVNDFRLFLISFSDHLTHSLISMFAVCTMLLRIYEELKWQHGNYTCRNVHATVFLPNWCLKCHFHIILFLGGLVSTFCEISQR